MTVGSDQSLLVPGRLFLDTVRKVLGNEGWNTIRGNIFTARVFADIQMIGKYPLDGTGMDGLALGIGDIFRVEAVLNLGDSAALVIHLESLRNTESSALALTANAVRKAKLYNRVITDASGYTVKTNYVSVTIG